MKTIGHCWVFDIKHHADRTFEKFKAWGHHQRPRVDCTETYTPMVSLMLLHLVLANGVCNCWTLESFDISGTYLYSLVKGTVFVEPPTQFSPQLKGKSLRLKKALYGMRQEGRCWWFFPSSILTQMGFAAIEVNQSLYIFHSGKAIIAIWVHVNNGVVASNSPEAVANFKPLLSVEVDIKWHDTISQIVGLECAFGEGEVTISQKQLTRSILDVYSRPIVKSDSPIPVLPLANLVVKGDILDPTPFQLVIGLLAYLIRSSRPDLALQ
ncbi:hypothetical protein O181_044887 [Austropuccinia psidii MF-1]|uniref:Reverse transcriptase Ty1/copia-type domain-containing protein n=1 Tax=Austropuccinia psidii MF-1 TaxID=1389203 RepID=A0A9Q3DSQ3_9BASI|nr:hypothetical protein [Austropuccinia psidii MF-1]